MSSSHYFSPDPGAPLQRRSIRVNLRGHDVSATTAGSVFSPDGLDKGTAVLLRHAPDPSPQGHLLDIGCGWGPIALSMGMGSPDATVWAVDVNERARMLCAENAVALKLENIRVLAPEEVPADIQFNTIWSNPPIRVGKAVLHQLLQQWLPRLAPGGSAWLVVQKNLGADSLHKWLADSLSERGREYLVDRAESEKGFRVLRVRRSETHGTDTGPSS